MTGQRVGVRMRWQALVVRFMPGRRERGEPSAVARLAALLALKRYEQPGPEVATRCRAAVLRRIRSGEPLVRPDEGWASGWAWVPVAGWGTAVVLAAALGMRLLTASPQGTPFADAVADAVAEAEAPAPVEPEQMAMEEGPQELPQEGFPAEWPPRIHRPTGSFHFIGSGQ